MEARPNPISVETDRLVRETAAQTGQVAVPGSLTLVIPAFNESTRIAGTLDIASRYLSSLPYTTELIVVDDGSKDDTAALARAFAETYESVHLISIKHAGKAAALRAGILAASSDLVAFSDADLATPLRYLDPFRDAILAGDDIVIGSREGFGAERIMEPVYRHVMGRAFNLLVRALLLPGVQDTQCGFKMFRREAILSILERARLYRSESARFAGPRVTAFDVELLLVGRRLGYRTKVVPVVWTYGTQSKVNPVRDTLNNFADVLKVKWNDLRRRYHA